MKLWSWLTRKTAVTAGFLLLFSASPDVLAENAVVRRVVGAAEYTAPDGGSVFLRSGHVLPAQGAIEAKGDSLLDIFLGREGFVLRIGQDSQAELNDPAAKVPSEFTAQPQLQLQEGTLMNLALGSREQGGYVIEASAGFIGTYHGGYLLEPTGVVHVVFGTVMVSVVGQEGDPTTVEVEAGNSYRMLARAPGEDAIYETPRPAARDAVSQVIEAVTVANPDVLPRVVREISASPGGKAIIEERRAQETEKKEQDSNLQGDTEE